MKTSRLSSYTLADLVANLDVTIKGDKNCLITGVSPIQQSKFGHISFLTNSLYRKYLTDTEASAIILTERDAELCPVNAVVTANPHFIYSKIAAYFDDQPVQETGIHKTAVIRNDCDIHPTVKIGPQCVIGNKVKLAKGVVVGPCTVIGDEVEIDEDTQLDARVTLYYKVKIGKRSRIASGAVIGSEGFGFAKQSDAWHKVPQLGSVLIGDDVDIGANTTIDRGAVDDTVIANGAKLDNLIQVGHNVRIGEHTIVAGCTGFAGSVEIGSHCMIGGSANFNGHITVCDHTVITGTTGVSKSIHEPGIYSSGIVGAVTSKEFKKNNARFYRLENLMERVKNLESLLKDLEEGQKS